MTSEIWCFLYSVRYDQARRDAKIDELKADLCEIILRTDRPTFVLRRDNRGEIHMHVTTSPDELKVIVERANADGSIGIDRNPSDIREWIADTYFRHKSH